MPHIGQPESGKAPRRENHAWNRGPSMFAPSRDLAHERARALFFISVKTPKCAPRADQGSDNGGAGKALIRTPLAWRDDFDHQRARGGVLSNHP